MKLKLPHVAAGLGLATAAGLAYFATRGTGPLTLPQFTESRQGPLMEHLVSLEELGYARAKVPVRYPVKVAPGLALTMQYGFAPLYQLPDPQAAALPAEQS